MQLVAFLIRKVGNLLIFLSDSLTRPAEASYHSSQPSQARGSGGEVPGP